MNPKSLELVNEAFARVVQAQALLRRAADAEPDAGYRADIADAVVAVDLASRGMRQLGAAVSPRRQEGARG